MSEKTIFSRIIDRELPADIIFENERIIVIKDIKPDAPVHWLGITKHPYTDIHQLLQENNQELLWELLTILDRLALEAGLDTGGYRLVTNYGPHAHQIVPHLHVHLLGGEKLQVKDPVPEG